MNHEEYGDPVQRPFWEGASQRELRVQLCEDCGNAQLYGRRTCRCCHSRQLHWTAVSGRAQVYSLTKVHGVQPQERSDPYVIALVTLDEGPRMMTWLVNGDCAIGDRVTVFWQTRDTAPPLAMFEPRITES